MIKPMESVTLGEIHRECKRVYCCDDCDYKEFCESRFRVVMGYVIPVEWFKESEDV